LGLLSHREDWIISSNAESGEGFSDILIEIEESDTGIVIEIKYPDDGNLETGCRDALAQIEERGYTARLLQNGMKNIVKYGIACYKKTCRVISLHS
ncbi:MAG: PD-(D/E)XK nuclease domain-containing protein, partial [Acetatifactor sp.]|nr:PD-(D/E)XK nuclease domain-containing protein [Acetatifactor sp.]